MAAIFFLNQPGNFSKQALDADCSLQTSKTNVKQDRHNFTRNMNVGHGNGSNKDITNNKAKKTTNQSRVSRIGQ